MNHDMKLKPIGRVKASQGGFRIEIDPEFRKGMEGLGRYSHLQVLFWFHHNDTKEAREYLTCAKPYRRGPETIGVFSTRSPFRPNPIGLSPVAVSRLDESSGVIETFYLDAEDGTPVLDLKPYLPCSDRVRDSRGPEWCAHWPGCWEENAGFDWEAEFNF